MKDKRSKLQIYYDIIVAINQDKNENEKVSKTRIQQKCNTSYDKLVKYLDEMEQKGLIQTSQDIEITQRGQKFFNDYSRVNNLIEEITNRLA